jgi:hypothetical protein
MSEEPLTLGELQTAKAVLEVKAAALRQVLHRFGAERPEGWQARFASGQDQLITVAGRIGGLNRRICALVESEPEVEEEGA